MKAEGLIPKPFVPKKRSFTFPPVEKMGQRVVGIEGGCVNDGNVTNKRTKHNMPRSAIV